MTDMYTSEKLLFDFEFMEYGYINYIICEELSRERKEGTLYRFLINDRVDHEHDFFSVLDTFQMEDRCRVPDNFKVDYSVQELDLLKRLPMRPSKIPNIGWLMDEHALLNLYESLEFPFRVNNVKYVVNEFEDILKISVKMWDMPIVISGQQSRYYNENQLGMINSLNTLKEETL